jgi:hypothetical protein
MVPAWDLYSKDSGVNLRIGEFFGLDISSLKAKIIFAQGLLPRSNSQRSIYGQTMKQ